MKRLIRFLPGLAMLGLAGCVIYLDSPPERKMSGQVVREDTGTPIANALIWFRSGRRPFSLVPVDTFGIDASTWTNKDGKFLVSAKLNGKVEVIVQNDEFFQRFELPPFPESNRIDGLIWRIKDRQPNQSSEPTQGAIAPHAVPRVAPVPSVAPL